MKLADMPSYLGGEDKGQSLSRSRNATQVYFVNKKD